MPRLVEDAVPEGLVKLPLITLVGLLDEFETKGFERGLLYDPVMLLTAVTLLVKFVLLLVDNVFPVTKGLELVLYLGTLFTPRDELKLLLGVITELGLIVLILELVVFVLRLLVLGLAIILSFNPMKVSSKFLSIFLLKISSLFFSIVSKQFDTNTSWRLL